MIKIKYYIYTIITILAVSGSSAVYALDTTETFDVGLVTNFEAYYALSFSDKKSHGLELIAGGGVSESFSYYLNASAGYQASAYELSSAGLGLIWTLVDSGGFALDFLPAFSFDGNKTSGNKSYPDFNAFTTGADIEFNIMLIDAFQPYILTGYAYSYDAESGDSAWQIPLALGVMIPVTEKIEFLIQSGWAPSNEVTWNQSERTAAAGVNAVLIDNLELISEVSWELSSKDITAALGVVFTF